MSIRFSEKAIERLLDGGANTMFVAPVLELREGAPPESVTDALTGNLVCEVDMPASDYFAAAVGTRVSLSGSWLGTASSSGTPGWFRIRDGSDTGTSSTTEARIDGTVGANTEAVDLGLDSASIALGDTVTVADFHLDIGVSHALLARLGATFA